jgi:tight adherence protein B
MELVVITFVLVLGIIGGSYWALVLRPEQIEEATLHGRLRKAVPSGNLTKQLLKEPGRLSDVGVFDRLLARSGQAVSPLQRLIQQSGLKITVGTLLLGSLCSAAVGFFLFFRLLNLPLIALFMACVFGGLPFLYVRHVRNKRMLTFEEQFPEAIDLLARALRAGHALTTGLNMVAEELPQPICAEFKLLYDQQNYGLPLPQALKNFAERIPTMDARFFVTAVLTQRDAGGNLSEVLDNLSSIIRERFKLKRQVRVISAHGRITGWVLSILPTALALFIAFTSPAKYRSFYTDPFGMQMIGFALVMQIIGVIIIKKIVTIEY